MPRDLDPWQTCFYPFQLPPCHHAVCMSGIRHATPLCATLRQAHCPNVRRPVASQPLRSVALPRCAAFPNSMPVAQLLTLPPLLCDVD
eukprot:9516393-Alexandrium_andersonii.AAC.1